MTPPESVPRLHPKRAIVDSKIDGPNFVLTLRCGHVAVRYKPGYYWARCEHCTGGSDPTPEQERVLDALRDFWDAHGRRPTWNELARGVERPRASVRGAVTALANKGLVCWEQRRPC